MSSYRAKQRELGGIRRATTGTLTEVSAKILGRAAAGRDPTAKQKESMKRLMRHCKKNGGAARVAVHTQCNYKKMRKGYAHVYKRKGKNYVKKVKTPVKTPVRALPALPKPELIEKFDRYRRTGKMSPSLIASAQRRVGWRKGVDTPLRKKFVTGVMGGGLAPPFSPTASAVKRFQKERDEEHHWLDVFNKKVKPDMKKGLSKKKFEQAMKTISRSEKIKLAKNF